MEASPWKLTDRPRAFLAQHLASWRTAYSEYGMHYFSMEFVDKRQEVGFAASMSKRLGRRLLTLGVFLTVIQSSYTILKAVDLMTNPANLDPRTFRWNRMCLIMDTSLEFLAVVMTAVGLVQRQCAPFSPRVLEAIFTGWALALLMTPAIADKRFVAKLTGEPMPHYYQESTYVALFIDAVVTAVSLTPVRWSSMWVVLFFSLFWYDLSYYIFAYSPVYASEHWAPLLTNNALTLLFLIGASAVGKRGHELQERRLYHTVAAERTLRAQSEFMLTQRGAEAVPWTSTAPSGCHSFAPSIETEKVFESSFEPGNLNTILSTIKRAARREQWLIEPEAISIHMSHMLGSGASGAVFAGSYLGLRVAVKFSLELISGWQDKHIPTCMTELRVLRKLRHPNIVAFYGAVVDAPRRSLALVLEMVMGCNLADYVARCRSLGVTVPDEDSYRLSCGLGCALRYLHSRHPVILHGDLKPANVLVELFDGSPPRAKLTDFGLSRILSGNAREVGGTLVWMAPELVQDNAPASMAIDTYGHGQLMLYMLSSRAPFSGKPRRVVLSALQCGMVPEPEYPKDPSDVAAALWAIALECIAADPCGRPTMERVCDDLKRVGIALELASTLVSDLLGHQGHAEGSDALSDIGGDQPGQQQDSDQRALESSRQPPIPWHAALQRLRTCVDSPESAHDRSLFQSQGAGTDDGESKALSPIRELGSSGGITLGIDDGESAQAAVAADEGTASPILLPCTWHSRASNKDDAFANPAGVPAQHPALASL